MLSCSWLYFPVLYNSGRICLLCCSNVSKLPCRLWHWQLDPPVGIPCGVAVGKGNQQCLDLGHFISSVFGTWGRRWTPCHWLLLGYWIQLVAPAVIPCNDDLQKRWISVTRDNEISSNSHLYCLLFVSQCAQYKSGIDLLLTQIVVNDAVHTVLTWCCLSFYLLMVNSNVVHHQQFSVHPNSIWTSCKHIFCSRLLFLTLAPT